jgi:hypothetical protein
MGAIDGTHVLARVPVKMQAAFRGRKHTITQNVLAAMDFHLRFTYVLLVGRDLHMMLLYCLMLLKELMALECHQVSSKPQKTINNV